MIRFKKISLEILIYGLGSTFTKLQSFVLLPLFTRLLSNEDFGRYEFLISFHTIILVFCLLQLESSLSRFYYSYDGISFSNFQHTIFYSVLVVSTGVCLILYLLLNNITTTFFTDSSNYKSIVYILLSLPFFAQNSLSLVQMRFSGHKWLFLWSQLINFLVSTTIIVYFFTIKKSPKVEYIFLGTFLGICSTQIIIWSKLNLFSGDFQYTYLIKVLKHSLPTVPAVFSSVLNNHVSRIIILGSLTLIDLGIYGFSIKLASVFLILGTIFRNIWPQFFWQLFHENPNHKEILTAIESMIASSVLILFVIFLLVDDTLVAFFGGSHFVDAIIYIPALSVGFIIQSILHQIVYIGPSIKSKTIYNTYVQLIVLIVNVGIIYLTINEYKLMGVTIAFFCSSFVNYGISIFVSEKLYPIGFNYKYTFLCLGTMISLSLLEHTQYSLFLFTAVIVLLFTIFKVRKQIEKIGTFFSN